MARSVTKKMDRQQDLTPPVRRSNPISLTLICLVYLILAIAYNLIVPAGTADQHNPDENAHVLYIQALATGHLPVFVAHQNAYENHQPPLYYVLCLPLYTIYKSMGVAYFTHALRFVSTLLGVILIWVSYKTTELLFPGKTSLSLSVAGLVAFLPMNINLNASVSNDTLTNLVIAIGLWQGVRIIQRPKDQQTMPWLITQSVFYGIILGIGILTKTSTLLLFPTAFLFFVLAARRDLMDIKNAGIGIAITLILGLVIGAPWLIRNQMIYGDPLAQHIFQTAFINTAQADTIIKFIYGGDIFAYFGGVAKWTFASYWGVFDSMTLFWGQVPTAKPPSLMAPLDTMYNTILAIIAVSIVGLIRMLVKKPDYITSQAGVALSVFSALTVLTIFVFLRFILEFFQAQGRYIYPSIIPLSVMFWLGLYVWTDKPLLQRLMSVALIFGLLALNSYTLFGLMAPRFAALISSGG